MPLLGKAHVNPESVSFGPLVPLAFDAITLAINQANTVIQGTLQIPCNFKVAYICANLTGAVAGTCSVNVCAGTGAEGTVGTTDTLLTNGQKLLSADTALTMSANNNQRLQASVPDAILPTSLVATVRTVTNGTASGTLKVILLGQFVDPTPTKPLYSAGNFTF